MEGHSVEHFGIMGIVRKENPPGTKTALKKMLVDFEGRDSIMQVLGQMLTLGLLCLLIF